MMVERLWHEISYRRHGTLFHVTTRTGSFTFSHASLSAAGGMRGRLMRADFQAGKALWSVDWGSREDWRTHLGKFRKN